MKRAARSRPKWRISWILGVVLIGLSPSTTPAIVEPTLFPFAPNCSVPVLVRLVGLDGDGIAQASAVYRVTVRNGWNNLMPGSLVVLSFAECGAARIASEGYAPETAVDCRSTHLTVRRITNEQGVAEFVIPGSARPGESHLPRCVKVSADGTLIGTAIVTTADLSSANGIDANDLSLWLTAFGKGDASLGDLNGDSTIGAGDLSEWLTLWGSGAEVQTPSSLCP